tara:strand:- start:261 stop:1610 length:1350 start_codon:yes stop_codon:yes gene_type:complete
MSINIVLIGAGEVGFSLSKFISKENYDLTVVDIDSDKCNRIKNTIDARVIEGNGCSQRILQKIDFENIDYFLALTKIDEVNLVASTIAKKLGAKNIIARLRNTEYIHNDAIISPKEFGINNVIYPEKSAQIEIENLVRQTSAAEIKGFKDNKIKLVGIKLENSSPLIGRSIKNVYLSNPYIAHRVPVIFRNDDTFIPHLDTEYKKDDVVYFCCDNNIIDDIQKMTGKPSFKSQNIMILGLGKISRLLAKSLQSDYNVKIIEKNPLKAKKYSANLDESLILVGDGLDEEFLESENIHEIDCFIATTENDKTNMLASLMVKYHGVKQVIMHVVSTSYLKSIRKIGIDSVVSKNISAVNDVLKIIHSNKEEITISPFEDIHIDAIEIKANKNCKYFTRNYSIDDIPESMCLGAIFRNGDVIIPSYSTKINYDDNLLIFLNQDSIKKAESLFN